MDRLRSLVFWIIWLAMVNCWARDFSYSESFRTSGEIRSLQQSWKHGFGWGWRNNALRYSLEGRSFAILRNAPWGTSLEVEAVVTVEKATVADWKVAGLTMKADDANYWHLALIGSPKDKGAKHFVELSEMYKNAWLSQKNLKPLVFEGKQHFDWKFNHPYRLRLSVDPQKIVGTVSELNGNMLWKAGFQFTGPAVKQGQPGFYNGGFQSAFHQFKTKITNARRPPDLIRRDFPAYTGSPNGIKAKATGFFHTHKIDGRWWIIAPDGSGFFAVATDHVNYRAHWCHALGYAPYHRNVEKKYGSEEAWARAATDRLKTWGFNALGAGCYPPVQHRGLAHTIFTRLGGHFCNLGEEFRIAYPADGKPTPCSVFPNVFHPRFAEFCRIRAEEVCAPNQHDPWLIGYFIDNELKWWGSKWDDATGLFDETMKKPAGHTAKKALIAWLSKRYKTAAALNKAWGAGIESFEALAKQTAVTGADRAQVTRDKTAFVQFIVDRYFQITTQAIREADPNHMVLGCRFAGLTNPSYTPAWIAAGKHCDIVTVNVYEKVDLDTGETYGHVNGVRTPLTSMFQRVNDLAAGAPFWVTEWSYPAYDSGLPCKHGAGQRVDTQAERSFAFSRFQQLLFGLPYMVGSSFFMWSDEPRLGISPWFPEDSNYGLVNEKDEPYKLLTDTCMRLNPQAAAIHDGRTAEIKVTAGDDGSFLVTNKGRAHGDCKIAVWTDGDKHVTGIMLPPGATRKVAANAGIIARPGGHYVRCAVELAGDAAEIDLTDNMVEQTFGKPQVSGNAVSAILVCNPSPGPLKNVPFTIKTSALASNIAWSDVARRVRVTDGEEAVPFQIDGSELAGRVSSIPAYGARNIVVRLAEAPGPGAKPAVSFAETKTGFVISNGRLKLTRSKATGPLFTKVELDGVELGSYTPMLHQRLPENRWNRADRIVDLKVSNGPVRLVLMVRMSCGEETASYFETACRIVVYPDSPWFETTALWVKNGGKQAWRLVSYYHAAPSNIAGSKADDSPTRNRWFDAKAGYAYGAFDPTKRYQIYFWKDRNGGQHPDARRMIGVDIAPGKTHYEPPVPLYIGAVKGNVVDAWSVGVKQARNKTVRVELLK